jgi:hypothetical protein
MVDFKYKAIKLFCSKVWNERSHYFPVLASVIFLSLSLISPLYIDEIVCNQCNNLVYAQIGGVQNNPFSNNASQQWTDKTNGVKIVFGYSPAKPVIDSPTELRFIVQDLKSGENLRNLLAHVIITANSNGQEKTFRFNNLTAPGGSFSLRYLFPDYGTYQVIAAVRSNTSAVALASFQIIVPFKTSNMSIPSALSAGTVIIIVGMAILAGVIIKTRKP